ncbi:MAG: pitrilysin family protein [Bryobacterales bacterium]|nr:pitrilysin family protein [Bryobacterales bacterium]
MKLVDRNTPPASAALPVVRIPRFERQSLSNGLRVVLLEDPRFPSISLRLGLPGGNKVDPPSRTGIAETMAAMMTDGTPRHDARALAEQSAQIGAQFHFSASDDFFMGVGTVLEDSFEPFLQLFTECLLDSTFPEEELVLRKQNRLHELMVERSEAGYWADARMYELAFGAHPYAVTSPEPEHVAALERDDLVAMARNAFLPAETVLVLVGDLPERASLLAQLEGTLGQWKQQRSGEKPAAPRKPNGHDPANTPIHLIHRAGSVQAELRMGRPAPSRLDAGYIPLTVLNTLLGGGASSRLFSEIREKQGLAYHVSSSFSSLVEGGILSLTTQVAMDRVGEAVRGLQHEIRRLVEEPIPAEELASVRNYINGTFVLRLESHGSLANQISGIQLLGLGDDYLETYTARVAAVTAGELQEIAARYFVPEDYALVVAGDASVLEPQLKQFGTVQVSEPGSPT